MIRVQFAMERPPAHADFLRGQCAVAAGFFQGANNQLFLRFLHRQIIALQQWRLADAPPPPRTDGGKSRAEMFSPRHSTTACSMAVRNSRTLPGQE